MQILQKSNYSNIKFQMLQTETRIFWEIPEFIFFFKILSYFTRSYFTRILYLQAVKDLHVSIRILICMAMNTKIIFKWLIYINFNNKSKFSMESSQVIIMTQEESYYTHVFFWELREFVGFLQWWALARGLGLLWCFSTQDEHGTEPVGWTRGHNHCIRKIYHLGSVMI